MVVKANIMKQKYLLLIILILHLGGCSSTKGQEINQCDLVEVILGAESIQNLLDLKESTNTLQAIRIIDLSGKLERCRSYFRLNESKLVEYFVVSKISPTINTGHYRDVVVLRLENEKNKYIIDITAASFLSINGKQSNHKVELEIQRTKQKEYSVILEKSVNWLDKPPSVDYDKIKN